MRIAEARVIVTSPRRNFVTLKLTTEDGTVGWGDATLNGRELAVASYLTDPLCPLLVGRDATRIEDTWQYFYRGAYWRRGPVTMSAIAAVDMALWDIKAKKAQMPLHELLGGKARDRVRVYAHATGAPARRGLHRGARADRHPGHGGRLRRLGPGSAVRPRQRHPATGDHVAHAVLPAARPAHVRGGP